MYKTSSSILVKIFELLFIIETNLSYVKGNEITSIELVLTKVALPVCYSKVTQKRLWKHLYDKLGGNPGSTSAATCTRRHYEK